MALAAVLLTLSGSASAEPPAQGPAPHAETKPAKGAASSVPDWLNNPPAWITWLSLGGGLGAFGWRLYEFLTTRRDRTTDIQHEIDAYWYNAIVIEQVLRPVLAFLQEQGIKYESAVRRAAAGSDPYTEFLSSFDADFSALTARVCVLRVISQPAFAALMARLDALDDAINLICYRNSTAKRSGTGGRTAAAELANAQVDCVSLLRQLHASMRAS